MTLGAVAAVTSGTVSGPTDLEIDHVVSDSRGAAPGALFVALVAERDGHTFVADARERGAAAALVDRPVAGPHVVVGNTLTALADLGRAARERIGDATVIGITGSTGKTSTKDLLEAALAADRRTAASPASFNNEIGVPLTLVNAGDDADAVIVEMGARGIGHIRHLCAIAAPTAGVITNIGVAHAERFGSIEQTAAAKGELLEALPARGCAVLNADDAMTPVLRARSAAPVLTAGHAAEADVRIVDVVLDGELRPRVKLATPWGTGDAHLGLRGAHQAVNAALAVAVAGAVGVPLATALAGLAAARGSRWRMELVRTRQGVVVLNDAYNANPTSVAAAVDALASTPATGRRWAVLGLMAELGARAVDEHRAVGEMVAAAGIDEVVVVGAGDEMHALAAAAGAGARVHAVTDAAAASALVGREIGDGDVVLVKASRVVGLELVALELTGEPAA